MTDRDLLVLYSEWLDTHGLMPLPDGDTRTHDDLVSEFLAGLFSKTLYADQKDGDQ